ncbi:hypothetical protein CO083_05325 [Candidatus Roizmanbacteria bacterium CG_4_9_14_0_8_um_filter_34_12]|uniref:DUF4012 domain-containing protein n=1 Tax=Candidatus Roizmanbacteria bacterium CG_4_9_14_0_8_um_filter_34_12 TaxID=1974840 RepID=A0A2M8DBI1_9BACT|nr:MAG: hypothetical protein CO083_05325 [Candidatus Roizmanbacteria bacterium CG_4_9_14_0_8_um_filter_34_12]
MFKKIILVFFVLIIVLVGLGYFKVYQPYLKIKAKGQILMASSQQLKAVFKKNNIDLIKKQIDEITSKYKEFKKETQSIAWLEFVPQVKDFQNGIIAGDYLLKAAKDTVVAIAPYADLIGFKKGEASFVEKSAEDRLQTAVLTLDKMLQKIDIISEDIKNAEDRINTIDTNRYPEKIGKTVVRERLVNAKEQFTGLASMFVEAKPFLKKLPVILGKDKEQIYLLLFQNDKEKRATGGFLTAYAIFRIKDGKMRIERSNDIYSLDASIANHPAAPDDILTYHKGVSQFYIRDSNLSPDFAESVKLFDSLYQKSNIKIEYDGIIAIDTKILVDMLSIFGDTEVRGIRFSADIDKRCNCPQVIYKLLDEIDRPVGYVKEDRKGILGDLMYALFYKAIGFSPSKYWGTLAQTMLRNLEEKHILLNFTDSEVQKSIEKLNYAGRIKEYNNDYLHVNNVNFAGAKSNLFVTESLISKAKTQGDSIEKELTVEFRNPYSASDCNLERGGLCLNAQLRNWIRVYVPRGSTLIDFQGSEMKVKTYEELGKTVFGGFLKVNPEGIAKVIIKYRLPKAIKLDKYSILVQKQPGAQKGKLKVEIDGKTIYDGLLEKDIEAKK